MRTILRTILCVLAMAVSLTAANYTVKAGGGGSYSTIQSCANAMAAGDTCTVFAGTYNESPTLSAGAVGEYKTMQVNGTDLVYVENFTMASHTKVIGFQIQDPSAPASKDCIDLPASTTDIFITNNTLYECGDSYMVNVVTAPYPSYVYIQGNTLSWSSSTPSQQNIGSGILARGDHWLIANNKFSHLVLTINRIGSYGATINNTYGPNYGSDQDGKLSEIDCSPVLSATATISGTTVTWVSGGQFGEEFPGTWVAINGTHYTIASVITSTYLTMTLQGSPPQGLQTLTGGVGGNCHTDFWFSEPGPNGSNNGTTQYNLVEGNTLTNSFGHDAKAMLAQADTCGGNCSNAIIRFNTAAHFGSAMMDNEAAENNVGYSYVKTYNNTWADVNNYDAGNQLYGAASNHSTYATNAAELNNIYYLNFSVGSFNPYYFDSTAITGASYGSNLAFCTLSPCVLSGHIYGGAAFTLDTGNQMANPQFNNYAGNDFRLAPNSPAAGAGTYLTTVASADSGAGTSLVVTDAGYFQDGLGLNAEGVNADCISVTSTTNHVCILAVNYSNNTLTLANSISRSPGDHVWLFSNAMGTTVLYGNAPNIGAAITIPGAASTLVATPH